MFGFSQTVKGLRGGWPLGMEFNPLPITPTLWRREKYGGNPVVLVTKDSPYEMYVPSPIVFADGTIWLYIKGASATGTYAFKSTDGGETFTIQNGGDPVLTPGSTSWDAHEVSEALAVYDAASDTIHLYYKGRNSNLGLSCIMHATAPGSDPTDVTVDATKPMVTYADITNEFGDVPTNIEIGDVIMMGDEYWLYGTYYTGDGLPKDAAYIFLARGSSWNDFTVTDKVLAMENPGTLSARMLQQPSIFRMPYSDVYCMIYTEGHDGAHPDWRDRIRRLAVATSYDGINWVRHPGRFLDVAPDGSDEWDMRRVYAAKLLKKPVAPYTTPYIRDGRMLLYYSGSNDALGPEDDPRVTERDQSGLCYIYPYISRIPTAPIPITTGGPTDHPVTATDWADMNLNVMIDPTCRNRTARLAVFAKSGSGQSLSIAVQLWKASAGTARIAESIVTTSGAGWKYLLSERFLIPEQHKDSGQVPADVVGLGLQAMVTGSTGHFFCAGILFDE